MSSRPVEHARVVGRQRGAARRRPRPAGSQAERAPRSAPDRPPGSTCTAASSQVRRHQRRPALEGERVAAPFADGGTGELDHELPRHALRRRSRRPSRCSDTCRTRTHASRRSAGLVSRMRWLASRSSQRQLLQALHDVVRVAQAHLGRSAQLLQPPRPAGLGEQHADDPRGPRGEERAERAGGRPHVALAFLLDQDVLEGEMAVARQVDEPEVVGLEDPGALGADVDGCGTGISGRQLPAERPSSLVTAARICRGWPSGRHFNAPWCARGRPAWNRTTKSAVWLPDRGVGALLPASGVRGNSSRSRWATCRRISADLSMFLLLRLISASAETIRDY